MTHNESRNTIDVLQKPVNTNCSKQKPYTDIGDLQNVEYFPDPTYCLGFTWGGGTNCSRINVLFYPHEIIVGSSGSFNLNNAQE